MTETILKTPFARAEMRVKIKSLAHEASVIRAEERQALRRRRKVLRKDKEVAGAWLFARYLSLRNHRLDVVRREARVTLLAYAFLRGVPYLAVEHRVSIDNVPEADRVAQVAHRFSRASQHSKLDQSLVRAVLDWMAGDGAGSRGRSASGVSPRSAVGSP